MACPICKNKNKIFSIKVKDYEYNIKNTAEYTQCKLCKSIYRSNPNKIKEDKEKLYSRNRYLPLKGNIIYDFLKSMYAKHEKKKIIKVLDENFLKKKTTILDIACGKGYLIKNFSKDKNIICYGSDKNIKTIKKYNVNFINAPFDNINLIKKIKPDLIIINNFIEHVENLLSINKIINHMKKGSCLIVITPDGDSLARKKFSNYWSGYHSPRHKVIFNVSSIKKFFGGNKKIKFKQTKIYDPFTNLLSISNLIKKNIYKFFLPDVFKIINFILYLFIDIRRKNRICMVVKKT